MYPDFEVRNTLKIVRSHRRFDNEATAGDGPKWVMDGGMAPNVVVRLIFALGVLACFSSGLDNYFSGDDYDWFFQSVATLGRPLAFFEPVNHFLRLTETAYFVVIAFLAGFSAPAFFAASVCLHVLNALLVYRFVERLCASEMAGLAGALFWSLNYQHAEVVFRQYGVADSLALLFALSALLLFFEERWILATLLFIPALFAKENAILVPAMAVLWVLMCGRGRRMLLRLIPMALVTGGFVLAEMIIRRDEGYLVIDWRMLSRYWDGVFSCIGPDAVTLARVHLGNREVLTPVWLAIPLSLLLLVVLLRLPRVPRFGLLWTSVMFLPTVPIIYQTSRYYYVPLVGFAIIVGWAAEQLRRRPKGWRWGAGVVFVSFLAASVVGIQIEESDHEAIGELHRVAAQSFSDRIVPELTRSPEIVTLFVRGPTMPIARALQERNHRPWYAPMTYKWLFRRPTGILGLANIYGFVSAYSSDRDNPRLFVAVSRCEFDTAIESGEFRVVVHDVERNIFFFADPALCAEIKRRVGAEDLYTTLQPGRFDPTFSGPSRLFAASPSGEPEVCTSLRLRGPIRCALPCMFRLVRLDIPHV